MDLVVDGCEALPRTGQTQLPAVLTCFESVPS